MNQKSTLQDRMQDGFVPEQKTTVSFKEGFEKGTPISSEKLIKELEQNRLKIKERIINSIWGFILGDCWGVPYEFKKPQAIKFKKFDSFGTHNQPAGTWSDDTSLMLCNMDSFMQGVYSQEMEIENLKKFLKGGYSINNQLFDVGNATKQSIFNPNCDKSEFLGNGGLLRCWLFAALMLSDGLDEEEFVKSLNLTHSSNEIALSACKIYFSILTSLWRGLEWDKQSITDYNNWKEQPSIKKLNIDGTIVNAVIISIDSFLQNKSIEEVIRLGEDTDSNAAVYGALYYANKSFPKNYQKKIRDYKEIQYRIEVFLNQIL